MPRGKTSRADLELISRLSERRVSVSPYQLERWRKVGLIPRNHRQSLGRGRGTISTIDAQSAICAEMLARSGPKPDSIMRYIANITTALAIPDWPVAIAPTLHATRHELTKSDLINSSEDEAYSQAEYFSLSYYSSFSRDLPSDATEITGDIVKHKRAMHQHYLVASYLGTNTVGRELLGDALIDLGLTSRASLDVTLDFLEDNFTPTSERIDKIRRAEFTEWIYQLSRANALLDFKPLTTPRSIMTFVPSEAQAARFHTEGFEWVHNFDRILERTDVAIAISLLGDQGLSDQVTRVLGTEFEGLLHSRLVTETGGVRVTPFPFEILAQDSEWTELMEDLLKSRKVRRQPSDIELGSIN